MYWENEQAISKLEDLLGRKFSEEQLAILKHKGGKSIIAGAGSGKTTIMVADLIKKMLVGEITEPHRVLCTTFSKNGATEIQNRLNALTWQLGIQQQTVKVQTMHAFYLSMLKAFGMNVSNIITDGQRLSYITQACKSLGYKFDDEERKKILDAISYQVNALAKDEQVVFNLNTELSITESEFKAIKTYFDSTKQVKQELDYDDLQVNMYKLVVMENAYRESIVNFIKQCFTTFYIDEAQDTSKIQFKILKELISDKEKLVFIGDDDQCIYPWRGADSEILLNIGALYDIRQFDLTTNYRCKSKIVNRAAHGIEYNRHRHPKELKAHTKGGNIHYVDTSDSLYEMSKIVMNKIVELVQSGEQPRDIAILVRNNATAALLQNLLYTQYGCVMNIPKPMRLTSQLFFNDVSGLFALAQGKTSVVLVEALLCKLVRYLKKSEAKLIGEIMNMLGLSLLEMLKLLKEVYKTGAISSEYVLTDKLKANLHGIAEGFRYETLEAMTELIKVMEKETDTLRAIGLLEQYSTYASFLLSNPEKERLCVAVMDYFIDVLEKGGIEGVEALITATRQYENREMNEEMYSNNITCMTIHGAKGMEWRNVFIVGDDNVTFPSFKALREIVQREERNPQYAKDALQSYLEEGRRLHYVAMTRAKENLFLVYPQKNPSVFLCECLGVLENTKDAQQKLVEMAKDGSLDVELAREVYRRKKVDGVIYENKDGTYSDEGKPNKKSEK